MGKPVDDRIEVLVEKLGHYPYRDGGYVVTGDFFPLWKWLGDYTQALASAGIALDGLSDQQKVKGR